MVLQAVPPPDKDSSVDSGVEVRYEGRGDEEVVFIAFTVQGVPGYYTDNNGVDTVRDNVQ